MPLSQPRGVRDFGPAEAIARKRIIAVIEETFKRFGFSPLETPGIENMETLNAKAYGTDASKQIYKLEDGESGLRFDLTIPMARYVAMNTGMPLPFKRYQIGAAWRKDEPQKMRYREFTQADADIVGSASVESEAEAISAAALAIDELGIKEFAVVLNSRVILDKVLASFGVPQDKHADVMRLIDKLDKSDRDTIVLQIQKLGVADRDAEKLMEFIKEEGSNDEKLGRVAANIDGAKDEVERLRKLLLLLDAYNLSNKVKVDLALARGLDYYTGAVWEYVAMDGEKRLPSIGSGGRYDKLLGIYAKNAIPAVGSSIGIDRVFDILEKTKPIQGTYAKLYIATIGAENYQYALGIAARARGMGIYTDVNLTDRNISKQLEYANSLKFRYAIIIGKIEKEARQVKLRDLLDGKEEMLPADEALGKMKE
ncbi:MAG: histidine--tRNA ligase [Candidatus Micrarchaeota archaeon]|nr:histidine--tRNA ligase [Candidatus Micrarchaeota archaeon]MDE1804956.1 histidine--tRNA ligase [Candidatus Micrarchaeota archaeon]MDE1846819.1 histidine--tRNA ligase [Candidatus Micrarchaeota archaeon]